MKFLRRLFQISILLAVSSNAICMKEDKIKQQDKRLLYSIILSKVAIDYDSANYNYKSKVRIDDLIKRVEEKDFEEIINQNEYPDFKDAAKSLRTSIKDNYNFIKTRQKMSGNEWLQ